MTCKRETELVGISRRYLTTARKGDRDNKVVDYHTRPRAEKLLNSRYLLEPTEFEMPHAYIPRVIAGFTSIQLAVTLGYFMFHSDKLIFAEQFNRLAFGGGLVAFSAFAFWCSLMLQDRYISRIVSQVNTKKVTIYTPFFLTERKIETETSSIRPALMKRVFGRKDASPLDLQNIRTFLIEVEGKRMILDAERVKKDHYQSLLRVLGLVEPNQERKE